MASMNSPEARLSRLQSRLRCGRWGARLRRVMLHVERGDNLIQTGFALDAGVENLVSRGSSFVVLMQRLCMQAFLCWILNMHPNQIWICQAADHCSHLRGGAQTLATACTTSAPPRPPGPACATGPPAAAPRPGWPPALPARAAGSSCAAASTGPVCGPGRPGAADTIVRATGVGRFAGDMFPPTRTVYRASLDPTIFDSCEGPLDMTRRWDLDCRMLACCNVHCT